ncbi:MAG TPA: L,D-transpeptidase family protein [Candidatus Corynebacterium avicola]|uniref:L,D-transpeptidase family protein n=1 Tax=Candidatus Corynebacterium avicola TaxID=2838527 RepID=A0A9D1RRI2_9CORY|nr:L,D-transpeptidase family protein [Candidatus Corynebacterium avicola]
MATAFAVAPAATAAPADDGGAVAQAASSNKALPGIEDLPDADDVQGWADDAVENLPGEVTDNLPDEVTDNLPDEVTENLPGDDDSQDQAPDQSPAPAPDTNPAPEQTPRTGTAPCAVEAKACIDLGNQTAWLQDGNGNVTRGPVAISSGRAGYETPRGTTQVTRKIVDEWSNEWDAPMPYSVYFSAGTGYPNDIGIAFHEGDPGVMSHGCIHLAPGDAEAFFNHLQVGDVVDVV